MTISRSPSGDRHKRARIARGVPLDLREHPVAALLTEPVERLRERLFVIHRSDRPLSGMLLKTLPARAANRNRLLRGRR
jgi:hypothetical protein